MAYRNTNLKGGYPQSGGLKREETAPRSARSVGGHASVRVNTQFAGKNRLLGGPKAEYRGETGGPPGLKRYDLTRHTLNRGRKM